MIWVTVCLLLSVVCLSAEDSNNREFFCSVYAVLLTFMVSILV